MTPYLLEINNNPSFAIPSELDWQIKGRVMAAALRHGLCALRAALEEAIPGT